MTWKLAIGTVVWLLTASVAGAQDDPRIETFTAAGAAQTSIALLPALTPGGAHDLDSTARCLDTSPRQGLIAMSWRPADLSRSAQRVDVSKFREGFETQRFEASPRLDPELEAIALQAPEPGIYYYWRVLSETPSGWISSPVARFEAPICPSDGPAFELTDQEESDHAN